MSISKLKGTSFILFSQLFGLVCLVWFYGVLTNVGY